MNIVMFIKADHFLRTGVFPEHILIIQDDYEGPSVEEWTHFRRWCDNN